MKTLMNKNLIIKLATAMMLTFLFSMSFQAHAATPKPTKFDHTQTGFILKDVHLTLQCEQCHVDGIFKNTPTYCSGCHAPGTRVGAMPQPLNHVQTTAACDTCHTSTSNFQVKSFNHMSVTGNCTTCHNGQSLGVVSMSSTHIPLTAYPVVPDCIACHTNTTTFASYTPANLHAGITSGCSQCHGGPPGADSGSGTIGTYPGVFSYNPATHLPLTTQVNCNSCHFTFSTFLGASYTHTSNDSARCGNCHEGQYAGVVPFVSGVHIPLPTGSNCAPCHIDPSFSPSTKPSFLGAAFHTSSYGVSTSAVTTGSGTCKTCHNGSYTSQNAQPVGATHIPTSADCSVCHTDATGTPINTTSSFTTFSNALFHQSSVGNPPAGMCSTCHNGSYTSAPENAHSKTSILPTHIPVTGDCGTCHTVANTGTYTTFLNAIFHQSPAGATIAAADAAGGGQCVTCHNGSYTAQLAQGVGATHIPYSADCSVCHTLSNTGNFSTFLNAQFHQSTAGNAPTGLCSTCHNGSYLSEGAYSTTSVISTHVTVAAGSDCVACHTIASTANYTTFLGATYAHSATYGAVFPQSTGQTPTCASCHNGTTAKGKVATHVTTPAGADCNSCHTPSTDGCGTAGNCSTFYGVIYSHTTNNSPYAAGSFPTTTTAPTPGCISCHAGSTLSALPVNAGHVSIGSNDCNFCHTSVDTGCGSAGNCTTFLGAKYNHGAGNTVTIAGACGSCHGQLANVVSLTSVNHIPQSNGTACDACHLAANTGIAGAFPTTVQTFANAQYHLTVGTAASTCSNCHNGNFAPGPTSGSVANTGLPATGALGMNGSPSYTHIATTADCNVCHSGFVTFGDGTTATSRSVMTHNSTTSPVGGCGTCHLGQYSTVISLASSHIPQSSGNACDKCHTSTLTPTASATFANVLFHSNPLGNPPTGTCSTCHSGSYTPTHTVSGANGTNSGLAATGASSKSSVITTHIATTADCVTCHTVTNTANYTTFLGASGYNHTATYPAWTTATTGFPATPSPTCASCHNGTTATGINAGHPAIGTTDCVSCHTSSILVGCPSCSLFGMPAAVKHNTVAYTAAAGGCVSCHNGTTAKGLSADINHIPIGSISCAQCHPVYDGTTSIDFSTAATTTLTPLPAGGTAKYVMNHLSTGTICGTSCHNGSYTSQGVYGAIAKTAVKHIPTDIYSTADCTGCHIGTSTFGPNTNFAITAGSTQWATATMSTTQHNGDQGSGATNLLCKTCHANKASGYQVSGSGTHSGHNSSKTDCSMSGCHKPLGSKGTAYTSWN